MNSDLSSMREHYKWGNLLEDEVHENPYEQFKLWLQDAIDANIKEANAMNLATANKEGKPSSRIVLLKEMDEDGLIFYTNYESKKGQQILENPFAALNFLWKEIERQVRVEGEVKKISKSRSEAYFHSRPYGSQVGALSSYQSRKSQDRKSFEERYALNFEKYKEIGKVPLPDNWGGYKLSANYFEFWQGRESRLHDRISYELNAEKSWDIFRLEP